MKELSTKPGSVAARKWYASRTPEQKRAIIAYHREHDHKKKRLASLETRKLYWATETRNNAKGRAKKTGTPFSIPRSEIETPDVCPVLGIALVYGSGKLQASSPSLDRRVPELGYTSGNVTTISHRANTLKNNCVDPRELSDVAAYVASHIPLQGLIEMAEQY